MKKLLSVLMGVCFILSAFTHRSLQTNITGSIDPADGASKVWAVMNNDTASTIPSMGKFALTVRPGNWMVVVEAIKPYKNVTQSVLVLEGGPTDMGVIKLQKE